MTSNESAPPAPEIGLTFDCADAVAQARFWKQALGYVDSPPPDGWDTWEAFLTGHGVPAEEWDDGATIRDPAGMRPAISFLKVPEPKRAKNRFHLDVKVSGGRHVDPDQRKARIQAKAADLIELGATVYERHDIDGRVDHVVMLDPEGNEFCLV